MKCPACEEEITQTQVADMEVRISDSYLCHKECLAKYEEFD